MDRGVPGTVEGEYGGFEGLNGDSRFSIVVGTFRVIERNLRGLGRIGPPARVYPD